MNAFKPRKAAHVTAYFAIREGGAIDVLKLAKLLYLAERAYLDAYELPLTGDKLVAMPHGPALSETLNHVNESPNPGWQAVVSERSGNTVSVVPGVTIQSLKRLSPANIEVLEEVWQKYGHLDGLTLRNFMHDNCAEWSDPRGSSHEISYADLFRALGKDDIEELIEEIQIAQGLQLAPARYGNHRSRH